MADDAEDGSNRDDDGLHGSKQEAFEGRRHGILGAISSKPLFTAKFEPVLRSAIITSSHKSWGKI